MARIELNSISHSYRHSEPGGSPEFALRNVSVCWEDGRAYALLGPSGCGKTTLLNIVSGLLCPTEGTITFNGSDVTRFSPSRRNIAQVFQFPVVYDSMTVADNLAFPLRNRKVPTENIRARVAFVAELLQLGPWLSHSARILPPEWKQLVSLGRGIVREDASAVLFDEPLTVVDPEERWRIRRVLKAIQSELGMTMVYVTHDQMEAMTFAEEVIVMNDGSIVQHGRPEDLFLLPEHRFVGHFIGSPGMNFLPGSSSDSPGARLHGAVPGGTDVVGVRPEFLHMHTDPAELTARVARVVQVETGSLVTLDADGLRLFARCKVGEQWEPGGVVGLSAEREHAIPFDAHGRRLGAGAPLP